MKEKFMLPVAQPKGLGTQIQQSKTHVNQPVALVQHSCYPTNSRQVEIPQWLIQYQGTSLYFKVLDRLRSTTPLAVGIVRGQWTRLAQQVINQARFATTSNPYEVVITHSNTNERTVFQTDPQTVKTLVDLTNLCDMLGQLSELGIYHTLTNEMCKYTGTTRRVRFVKDLQAFIPKADIEYNQKLNINSWINKHLPEAEWVHIIPPQTTMQVHSLTSKPRRGRPCRVSPMDLKSALIGRFTIALFESFVSLEHIGYYDFTKSENRSTPSQWASLYWALYLTGYIQKLPVNLVPILFKGHFQQELTSKTTVSNIGNQCVQLNLKAAIGTEVERLVHYLKMHYPT